MCVLVFGSTCSSRFAECALKAQNCLKQIHKYQLSETRLTPSSACLLVEQRRFDAMGNICYTTGTDGKGTAGTNCLASLALLAGVYSYDAIDAISRHVYDPKFQVPDGTGQEF